VHLKADDQEKKLQRMHDPKEEKKVHKNEEDKELHRMDDTREEKKLHKKEDKELHHATNHKEEDKKLSGKKTAAATSAYVHSLDGKGQSLPEDAKHFFGERMDHDFSEVRIHTGTEAGQSTKAVNAKAYTVGYHIVFNDGQYNPASQDGKKLLVHELAHVVQNNGVSVSRKAAIPEKE